jgi:RNA polymerase sigma-70 factor (ECF subfamily)
VLAAGAGWVRGEPVALSAREALAALCEAYWYPLYAFVRRRGFRPDEAADLTQSFFASLLERGSLGDADQSRGRFRNFLLGALDHFLANEWRREQAQKRGGGQVLLPLDFEAGEQRYLREPVGELTPEREFERRWALALLDQVLGRLRDEYLHAGKLELFEHLHDCLLGDASAVSYERIGARLGMSEGSVKVAAHRLRRRCRDLLRAEIAQTVASPDEVEDAVRHLFDAVRG